MDSLQGKLLVAMPALFDPNFRRTVVLLGEHGEDGAMGLVLNRPTDVTIGEAAPPLAVVAGEESRVHVGGPVQPEAVLVLAEFDDPAAAASIVVGDVGFASSDGDLDGLAGAIRRARVFAGYSGWGPGQLESELEEESWLVEPAEGVDLFPEPGDDLFAAVLRRKGGTYRVLAMMPEDPSSN
jgi:putative transcriptional regulator